MKAGNLFLAALFVGSSSTSMKRAVSLKVGLQRLVQDSLANDCAQAEYVPDVDPDVRSLLVIVPSLRGHTLWFPEGKEKIPLGRIVAMGYKAM